MKKVGSKLEVWRGKAEHTAGGLRKSGLMKNKRGRIVSIKQHKAGIQRFAQNKKYLTPFIKGRKRK